MADVMGSVFDPEAFSAGGFLDDVDCVIVQARVVTGAETPMGSTEAAQRCYLKIIYQPDGGDTGSDRDEYYSIGPLEKFTPSKDGTRLVCEPGTKIHKSTKSALFFVALVNAGYPKSQLPLDGSVTFLENLHVHVNNVPMPEMRNSKFAPQIGPDGKVKQATVVVVTQILAPAVAREGRQVTGPAATTGGAQKPRQARVVAPKPNGGTGEAPDVAPGPDPVATTEQAILALLDSNPSVNKKVLPTEMMTRITDAKLRTASFKLIGNPEWLGSEDRPWVFDAGKGILSAL